MGHQAVEVAHSAIQSIHVDTSLTVCRETHLILLLHLHSNVLNIGVSYEPLHVLHLKKTILLLHLKILITCTIHDLLVLYPTKVAIILYCVIHLSVLHLIHRLVLHLIQGLVLHLAHSLISSTITNILIVISIHQVWVGVVLSFLLVVFVLWKLDHELFVVSNHA